MTSSGFDMEVTGLYGTGRSVSGRSTHGGAAARRLLSGLDAAAGGIGHAIVKGALASYVADHLLDHATKLPSQLEAGGHNVSGVAATARDGDNAGAAALRAPIGASSGLGDRINREIPAS